MILREKCDLIGYGKVYILWKVKRFPFVRNLYRMTILVILGEQFQLNV